MIFYIPIFKWKNLMFSSVSGYRFQYGYHILYGFTCKTVRKFMNDELLDFIFCNGCLCTKIRQ